MVSSITDRLQHPSFLTSKNLLALIFLGFLSACATSPPNGSLPVMEEQKNYAAHARSYYAPPGPPEDPWGPYIKEASVRFDVPELWIRSVINRESGGRLYDNDGNFITSLPGAMGLMQLMPPAYDDLRQQYDLGPDPYAPHDNILAGTAYIRQMYDIYGSPGFLAAYNDGPGNLDRYLRQNRPLPKETRNYVAAIGREIAGIWPQHRSQADLLVARHDPTQQGSLSQNSDDDAPSTDQLNAASMKDSENQSVSAAWAAKGFTSTPTKPSYISPASKSAPAYTPHPTKENIIHIHNIPLAYPHKPSQIATDIPSQSTSSSGSSWSIQVGSYNSLKQAQLVASKLRSASASTLKHASLEITHVKIGAKTLYRTRFTHLTATQAQNSCKNIRQINACIPISANTHF